MLTIRLRARDFYEVIVNEGEASNLIVLVESQTKHKILHKKKHWRTRAGSHLKNEMRQENDCFATRYLSRNR